MNCPQCNESTKNASTGETLVGYPITDDEQGREHHHNDNCLKRYYICKNGHRWIEALQRTCNVKGCEWKGKEKCFCHNGTKVNEWTDKEEE